MSLLSRKQLRSQDLISQDKLDSVTIVGLGGIGSGLVMLLATMGFKEIVGYDHDAMEEHNFGTTLYPESWYHHRDSNMKAGFAKKIAKNYGGIDCEPVMHPEKFVSGSYLTPKAIVCTDDMLSRKTVYEEWLKLEDRQCFIDLRMDALTMTCVTITKDSDVYLNYWFEPGGSGPEAPCTMKHTIFCANLISGIGVNQLFHYLTERPFYQYIYQGLSPLTQEVKDFYCGETIVENNTNNILTEENVYANTNSYGYN